MTDLAALRALVESETLGALTREVCEATGSTLFPGYPDVMFQSLVRRVDAAQVRVDDLGAVLASERAEFMRYAKRAMLAAGLEGIGQDFPPGYDPTPDDFSRLTKVLGVAKDFLVRHLVDYLVLSRNDGHLERYLAATRTPNARKQAAWLRATFAGSREGRPDSG